ncbi:hypothetical protein NDU88_004647 [Pleurodeles waltl]|uniref:CCHC-type domain-containing protein n=1 Tax=Pleurodeles waltl TaxID=8319 RepID=A0AAV7QCW7_PLEWA|nr:hypothetical protein NDU88_004647 [Pleurodeles waltl]
MHLAITQTPEKSPPIIEEWADLVQTHPSKRKTRVYVQIKQGGQCDYCGREEHPLKNCPAHGRTCSSCGRMNHFATVCRGCLRRRGMRGRRDVTRAIKQLPLKDSTTHEARYQAAHSRLGDSSSEKEEEVFLISYTVDLKQHRRTQLTCVINIAVSLGKALIYTRASVNVMGLQQYDNSDLAYTSQIQHQDIHIRESHSPPAEMKDDCECRV